MTAPPEPTRRAIWSWALYDFANSPFSTLIVTFVYVDFFARVIVGDKNEGTVLWTRGVALSAILIAGTSPLAGAVADRGGYRKLFLVISTLVCAACCVGLYFVEPGQVVLALAGFVLANTAFELGGVFYNAFLPDVAPRGMIGRISGYGWGLGYFGGLLALVVALLTLVKDDPWLGFTLENGQNIRATNLLVAVWFVVFSLPIFFFVHEDRSCVTRGGGIIRASWRQLRGTFREVRRYRQIVRFLLARLVFNDALVTIFFMGGLYASGTFGFAVEELLYFGIALNVTAGLGALVFGLLDDRLGGRATILASIAGLILATILAAVAQGKAGFWVAALLVGICSGPNQSASRSLMGRFVPPEKENEFFGFFAFSGKATAFVGPLLFGVMTDVFGSQRAGIALLVGLFFIGGLLLLWVDEKEGIATAGRAKTSRDVPPEAP